MKAVLFDLGGTLWAPFGCLSREDVTLSAAEYATAQIHAKWYDGLLPDEAYRRRKEFVIRLSEGLTASAAARDDAARRGAFADAVFEEDTVSKIVEEAFRLVWGRDCLGPGCALAFGHALTKHSTPYPESAQVLAEIKAAFPGICMGIVSNTVIQPEVLDHYLQVCELYRYFDFRIYSSSVGWRKPHPAIYALALAEARARAAEVVFVGDRIPEDIQAPKRLGMRTILCRRAGFSSEDPCADAVAYDLTPVPGLVRKFLYEESS